MTTDTAQTLVYAAVCDLYRQAGWPCVIPVPPDAKFPPPGGYTGADGRDTTPDDLASWAASHGTWSVALRMPDGVIGTDVDEYIKGEVVKHGAATMARLIAELGPLPPTWSSTARGPGQPSRISFYQVPPGRYAGQLGPDVEIIQRHHRYAVVAPSPHHGAGADYAWYRPDGTMAGPGEVPSPGNLPELPGPWVRRLAEGASAAGPAAADRESAAELYNAVAVASSWPQCVAVARAVEAARLQCLAAEAGSRHDAMTEHVYQVVMLAAEGHPGWGAAMAGLEALWGTMVAGEGRDAEFSSMAGTAWRKAASKYGTGAAEGDPCLTANQMLVPAPAPEMADGESAEPVEPPRFWSPFGCIGAEPFEPAGGLDAPLSRDVLARTWPVLRYAVDAGAWLARGPEKWDVRKGDLAPWAVDLVFWLMLPGDPDAPEGSDDWRRAKQRARFGTNASANAIAGKMKAQVAGGHHPSSLELSWLDADREILWAGGLPFDLRASGEIPTLAKADPGTPHLHSAAMLPALPPWETPLWDTLCAEVWPDEAVRAWALRVLGIAFTGYSDKALPILLGDTDMGKTSIIDLLMSVLGTYAHTADARLLSPADKSHASIVYALKGRRLSFIDEAPRAGALATERLKQLTGGADLTGNQMQQNPVTWSPTHTLILSANPEHEPVLTDAAIRRRVRLIPCGGDAGRIREAREAIGAVTGKAWQHEAPGVLAKMMAEAAAWLADPASASNERAPEAGKTAVAEIRESQDHVLAWLNEECEPHEAGTRSRELYKAFADSCRKMAMHPGGIPTETRWGRRLNELGYPSMKREDANYRGLRVRELNGTLPYGGSTLQTGRFQPPAEQPSSNGQVAGSTVQETIQDGGLEGTETITRIRTRAHAHTGKYDSASSPPTVQEGTGLSLSFDLETADSKQIFRGGHEGPFVRLAGIAGPGGCQVVPVPHLLAMLGAAGTVSGHNILGFDGIALARHEGLDFETFARKALDTELVARQYWPPRSRESGSSEDKLGLDAVAARLGLPGKTDDLKRIAKLHGGYDRIPPDDPEYVSYLRDGDLPATRAVAAWAKPVYDMDPYLPREHQLAAIAGRMRLNGLLVDQDLLEQRYQAGEKRKRDACGMLHDGWGLPLGRTVMRGRAPNKREEFEAFTSPLSTDEGRAWLKAQWARYQVPEPPRTAKTGKLALGAAELGAIARDPDCPPDLRAMITLMNVVTTTRTVYQTATEWLCADGRVHPGISFRQASGRWSVTDPGLTVFGKHGGRHVERDIFVAGPGKVLMSFDLSQIDMRVIAGHCQDPAYMALFGPGRDAHDEIAARVFGEMPRDEHGHHPMRQAAKARGHGWNYGMGPERMVRDGIDPALAYGFDSGMRAAFGTLCGWREGIQEAAAAGQVLDNGWGRRMRAEPSRGFTVGPALMGQGGARDALGDCMLRLDPALYSALLLQVHDELLFEFDEHDWQEPAAAVRAAMTSTWRGVPITVDTSGPGRSFGEISAK
jgi:P4 family phage/plasmid primase-like protien